MEKTKEKKSGKKKNLERKKYELLDYVNALNVLLLAFVGIACGILFTILFLVLTYSSTNEDSFSFRDVFKFPKVSLTKKNDIKAFSSKEEFVNYLAQAGISDSGPQRRGELEMMIEESALGLDSAKNLKSGTAAEKKASTSVSQRTSTTNVQVVGIDEPDILKTDGKNIYFSVMSSMRKFIEVENIDIERKSRKDITLGETKLINAFPPADLKIKNTIDKQGDLLLQDDTLIIFSDDRKIYGYNVSNLENPFQKWMLDVGDDTRVVTSRLLGNKIYLVTSTRIDHTDPCPISPLSLEGVPVKVNCVDIYHPIKPVPTDITYNVIVLDATKGTLEEKISFVGSSDTSAIYMSENSVYITYQQPVDEIDFFIGFSEENGDLIPKQIQDKLKKIQSYEISKESRLNEMETILEGWAESLDEDEELRIQNEVENRIQKYVEKHQRDFEKTGIVKIATKSLKIEETGNVPGILLNQFSLDEYEGNLRIATTIGDSRGFRRFGSLGSVESVNDVYVLDSKLNIIGYVLDLGKDERIYSARFVGNKGYVVTFKEIDPFYVIDLSNPKNPQMKGELKIPGYSSYLHPIDPQTVLGIGKEDSQVKISLFDVSSAENPIEKSKYTLDEYWSDILDTHHAFLLDSKHEIFFIPGNKGGYVMSYTNDNLELKKAVSNINAKRALYLDDYLYILGGNKIVVLDENTFEEVRMVEL
jgi:uncharacterized secreted protein with C-terminal beta-propeller domain